MIYFKVLYSRVFSRKSFVRHVFGIVPNVLLFANIEKVPFIRHYEQHFFLLVSSEMKRLYLHPPAFPLRLHGAVYVLP